MSFFSEGVTKNKLIILHFMRALGIELTRDQITTFSAKYELIPFFDLQSAVYELEAEGFLAAVPRPRGQAYCLTPKGDTGLKMFEERLPLSERKAILAHADEYREQLRQQSQYSTSMERIGASAYRVELRVMDKEGELLKLNLMLPDVASARHACETWVERATDVYQAIMAKITE